MRQEPVADPQDIIYQYYQDYYKDIFAFVNWMVSNTEDATDITQEVFLLALDSISKKGEEIKNPKAWLLTIARNRAISVRKKRLRDSALFEQAVLNSDVSYTIDDDLDNSIMLEKVYNFTKENFTEKEQLVFTLRFNQGLELKEIAQVSGLFSTTVSKLITRLVKRLAKHFEDFDESKS